MFLNLMGPAPVGVLVLHRSYCRAEILKQVYFMTVDGIQFTVQSLSNLK
jgi:hypothetical protein